MSEKIKQADSGIPDVSAHRQLSAHEEDALDAGKSRWLPRVFQSYGTPIPDLMASPLKTGLIFGLPAGVIGAGLGSALGGAVAGKNNSATGALIGGLGAGGLAALAAGMDREAKNEGLEELMRRMPEGASKRDLLADPQYQSDFLGWDNNKIVSTARARYYRPTERFSKRTTDMADARARYNERHKTSSSNKDFAMAETEKRALNMPLPVAGALGGGRTGGLGGAGIGALYGALSAKPGKRLRGALRGLGGGALVGGLGGAGAGLGVGATFGYDPAKLTQQNPLFGPEWAKARAAAFDKYRNAKLLGASALGGVGGLGLGLAALDRSAPEEDDKKQNNNTREDEEGDEDVNETRKAAQALLDNKDLTLAEKMAQYKMLLEKQADPTLVTSGGSAPQGAPPARSAAPGGNQPTTLDVLGHLPGAFASQVGKAVSGANDARLSLGKRIGENVFHPAAQGIYDAAAGDRNAINSAIQSVQDAGSSAYKGVFGDKPVLHAAGRGLYNAIRAPITAAELAASGLNSARKNVGGFLGENVLYPAAKGLYNAPSAIADMFKSTPPPPPPSMMQQIMNSKYTPYALGGAAALGLGGLGYSMMSKGKKKKQRPQEDDEEEDDDMEYNKAANINWYALAKQANIRAKFTKRANPAGLIVRPAVQSLGMLARQAIPRIFAGGGGSAAASGGSGLMKTLGALGLAGGTGAGIGAAGGLFAKNDPSLLQQVMNYKYTPHIAAGVGTAGLLGGAAYLGSRSGEQEAGAKKKKRQVAKVANAKQADMASAGLGAGAGALAGGGLGALYGALNPGQERDPESGRTRRRSRLMAALRGLAAGGVAGGVGGAALGHFRPDLPNGALDRLGMGRELKLPPAPTGAENMASNAAQMPPAQRKLHEFIMQRNKVKAPATPDGTELARAEATVGNMGEEPGMNDVTKSPNPAMAAQMAQQ